MWWAVGLLRILRSAVLRLAAVVVALVGHLGCAPEDGTLARIVLGRKAWLAYCFVRICIGMLLCEVRKSTRAKRRREDDVVRWPRVVVAQVEGEQHKMGSRTSLGVGRTRWCVHVARSTCRDCLPSLPLAQKLSDVFATSLQIKLTVLVSQRNH